MSSEEEVIQRAEEVVDKLLEEITNTDNPDSEFTKYSLMEPLFEREGDQIIFIVGVKAILANNVKSCEGHRLLSLIDLAVSEALIELIKNGEVDGCGEE